MTRRLPSGFGIAGAAAFLFLVCVGMPLTDGDTAYYARVALNILETGEWQTLQTPYYSLVDKPPLTMWLMAVSFQIFGVNEVAARGWHALMAVGVVLFTYFSARLYYSERIAALSAWILLTSALFVYCGVVPQQDVPLTFFSTAALYGFARLVKDRAPGFLYLIAISMALGALSRGVQAVIFPVAVMGLTLLGAALGTRPSRLPEYIEWVRKSKAIAHGIGATALFLAIAAPWFVLEARAQGPIFISVFFDQFVRPGGSSGSSGVLSYLVFLVFLLISAFPWSGLLFPGLHHAFRRVRAERGFRDLLFLLWLLVGFGIPLLSGRQVIRYLLPALPPLAVLIAAYLAPLLEHAGDKGRRAGQAPPDPRQPGDRGLRIAAILGTVLVLLVLWLTIAFIANGLPNDQRGPVGVLLPFLITMGVGLGFLAVAGGVFRRHRTAVGGLIVASFLSYVVLFVSVSTSFDQVIPWKRAAAVLSRAASPGDALLWADGEINWLLDFYLEHPMQYVRNPQAIESESSRGVWVIGSPDAVSRLQTRAELDLVEVERVTGVVIARARGFE